MLRPLSVSVRNWSRSGSAALRSGRGGASFCFTTADVTSEVRLAATPHPPFARALQLYKYSHHRLCPLRLRLKPLTASRSSPNTSWSHTKTVNMSTYASNECRRVSPSIHGNKFDTAHRKKAVANIFENVNQDSLMRLFQKTGDMKAEERVRSIFSYTQDPEETARALMALKQRKKDKFLQIAGMVREFLKIR